MAFDLKLLNGDLSLDSVGRMELVRDSNKLVQEVLKLISTTLNSDPFNPNYGLTLTASSLGHITTANITAQRLESEIRFGLQSLQQEQLTLSRQQVLTSAERIKNIDSVIVEQDASDPRQYNIFIELTTQAQTPITVNTAIRA